MLDVKKLLTKVLTQLIKLNNIQYLAIDTSTNDNSANAVGSKIDNALSTDTAFIGYYFYYGKNFIAGYHYMSGGAHYFTAIMITFGSTFYYQGLNGAYTRR